jgi:hypothetical protein
MPLRCDRSFRNSKECRRNKSRASIRRPQIIVASCRVAARTIYAAIRYINSKLHPFRPIACAGSSSLVLKQSSQGRTRACAQPFERPGSDTSVRPYVPTVLSVFRELKLSDARQVFADTHHRRGCVKTSTNPPSGRLGCFQFGLQKTGLRLPAIPQPAGWGSFKSLPFAGLKAHRERSPSRALLL